MKILVLADIHNDTENLMKFLDKVEEITNFDLIVAIGDFTDVNIPKGFTAMDIGKIIIEILKTRKKPILAVPGNFDKELIKLFEDEDISLHGRGKIIEDVGFYGYGGAKTPFGTPLEPSENEIYQGLENGWKIVKDCRVKIQITHVPPFNTTLDVISSGFHVGSKTVRKFIEDKKPEVALCAHIHEAKGTDLIGDTKLLNPGRFPEGYAGIVDIKKEKIEVKPITLL